VSAGRRGQLRVLLGIVRLLLARQRENLPAVAGGSAAAAVLGRSPGDGAAHEGGLLSCAALALISLGIAEVWAARGRPGRAAPGTGHRAGTPDRAALSRVHWAGLPGGRRVLPVVSVDGGAQHGGGRAGPGARLDGQTGVGIAYMRLDPYWPCKGGPRRQRPWVQHAERTIRAEAEPAAALGVPTSAGCWSWRGAGTPTRCPRSGPPGGWPGSSPSRNLLAVAAHAFLVIRPGAPRRDRRARAGPRRPRRTRARAGGDAHRRRGAAARPGRPARGDRRARAGPGRFRPGELAVLAG